MAEVILTEEEYEKYGDPFAFICNVCWGILRVSWWDYLSKLVESEVER